MNQIDQDICQQAVADFRSGKISESAALKILVDKGEDPDDALQMILGADDCIVIEEPNPTHL